MPSSIYCLIDPRNNTVKYVGKTHLNPNIRMLQHLNESKFPINSRSNKHRIHWLRQLTSLNLLPEVKLLESTSDSNWQEREKYWIKFYRTSKLTNISIGGEGRTGPMPLDARKQLSKRLIGNKYLLGKTWKLSEDAKENHRAALRKLKQNKNKYAIFRKKISNLKRGSKLSEQTKIKISLAKKGKPGHKHSESVKRRIRLTNIKTWNSKEKRSQHSALIKRLLNV